MTELEHSLQAKVDRLEKENQRLRQENQILRQKLNFVIRQIYGSKGEKFDSNQLELFEEIDELEKSAAGDEEAEELTPSAKPSRRKSAKRSKPRIPEDLPVEKTVIEPEAVKACPQAWRCIGEEVSELLDYQPGKFFRHLTIRPKYVRIAAPEKAPIIAKLPAKLQDRGMLAPGLLTKIVIGKYADHLPLYRQEKIFESRHDVYIPRQTMANGVELVADWLTPIVDEMSREQFASGYVQIDETPVKYLTPGEGKTGQGYLWACHQPGGDSVYHWYTGRGHECLKDFVPEEFEGVIQCDAFGAYRTFRNTRNGIELAGCWAHARRKFYEAHEQGDAKAKSSQILNQIGELYEIEGWLRKMRAGPEEREKVRRQKSRPIIEELHKKIINLQSSRAYLPKSLFGKALSYALNQWAMLNLYLEDGRVEIDNNLAENSIRPTALGKKNWLFFGAAEAGERSAVIYSVINSCRSRGIDPFEYLLDVLTRLPSATNWQIPELTPKAWADAKEQQQTLPAAS